MTSREDRTITERLAAIGFTHAPDDLTSKDGRHVICSGGCPVDRVSAKEAIDFLIFMGEST